MALTPVRKWLNIGVGLVLLVFIGALLWPLVSRPFELRSFCASLQPGLTHGAVRNLADGHGFKVSAQSNGVAHVYDHQSLGKFSCTLSMQGDRLGTSSFALSD